MLFRTVHLSVQFFHCHNNINSNNNNNKEMNETILDVPFCFRSNNSSSEGFYFVHNGVLVLDHDTKIIRIYEKEIFDKDNRSTPVLQIVLSFVSSVQLTMIQSRNSNWACGRMKVIGTFDRGIVEMLTFKMSPECYKRLCCVLQQLRVTINN